MALAAAEVSEDTLAEVAPAATAPADEAVPLLGGSRLEPAALSVTSLIIYHGSIPIVLPFF